MKRLLGAILSTAIVIIVSSVIAVGIGHLPLILQVILFVLLVAYLVYVFYREYEEK